MQVRAWALAAISRYRRSAFHERNREAACCRFTPTCSHYAEDALRRRSVPVALALIVWRILRCNRFTPAGTYDPVAPRNPRWARRVFAVLALSGLTTLFVTGTASALTAAPALPGQTGFGPTQGGCTASVAGRPINVIDAGHPLQVHKGQAVVLTGRGPANVAGLQFQLHSTTDIQIHFVENLAVRSETHEADGQNFQRVVNVDTYLKYGSGIYRVSVHSVARPGWDCSAVFYVEMHGSKLAAEVAVAVGAIGAVGVAMAAGDENPPPEPLPRTGPDGLYDPTVAPDAMEKANAAKDKAKNAKATSTVGCLAAILFALIASTGAFALAAPTGDAAPLGDGEDGGTSGSGGGGRGGGNAVTPGPRTVWVRGHPILGFVSGLFMGLGITVALQQFNVYPLNLVSAIVAPLVTAILGGWRGWRGCAWKVG